jgi:cysteine desulfurase
MKVYLDYAATTPVKKEVLEVMLKYFKNEFGNPSSIHSFGREAKKAIEDSRATMAGFLGASPLEIIFTGSGSESDNLAIKGLIYRLSTSSQNRSRLHIITSQIEHHAVLHSCQKLEKMGLAEVTYVKPNTDGIIETEKVKKAIRLNTVLVSVMYANNEIGAIQPIREIGKMIEKENKSRKQRIYFHTDAVQAAEFLPMNVDFLHVNMLTIAGHKIGAPKGVGVLYVRKGTPLASIIDGGEQERGLRAGTENTAFITGLGKAVEIIQKSKIKSQNNNSKLQNLRDYFVDRIVKEIPEIYLNGSKESRTPNNANLYFKNIEGESIVLALDLEGVACSTGSACTSQSLEPSHVIMAIFDDPMRAAGSVRFSFGQETTKAELDFSISKIKEVVKRLRAISPYN